MMDVKGANVRTGWCDVEQTTVINPDIDYFPITANPNAFYPFYATPICKY